MPVLSILCLTNWEYLMTRWKATCSFPLHFPPYDIIISISKLTHITTGIKALLTATWDLPVRNSTTQSESKYSLPASDLFMRANKAIRWGNLPSGRFMCVLCTTECWEVLWLYSFPASWLLWGTGISLCQKLTTYVRFRLYIYPHLCPLPPRDGLQSLLCAQLPHSLGENPCNLNRSYSTVIAQTCPEGEKSALIAHGQTQHLCCARVSLR